MKNTSTKIHGFRNQKKSDKKKLYSIHESQVECIGKGKARKKFEFGTKVGLVTSAKANWIVGAEAATGEKQS